MEWSDKCISGEVRESTTRAGRFRLTVHQHVHHDPGEWFASCPALFDCVRLASPELDYAKAQAVAKLQVICQEAINEITQMQRPKE